MHGPPKRLNPAQRALVAPWSVHAMLLYVALLGVLDVVQSVRHFVHDPSVILHPSATAIRLVVAGVYFELRGNFVKHLLGEQAAASPREAHVSETCEIYGGYLTVAGLIIELVENTRDALPRLAFVNPVANVLPASCPCSPCTSWSISPGPSATAPASAAARRARSPRRRPPYAESEVVFGAKTRGRGRRWGAACRPSGRRPCA